jgi:hypothetical protein
METPYTPPYPTHRICSEYDVAMIANTMQRLVVTDVDETITHKPNATKVELNQGVASTLAAPDQADGTFVVFSTGRTRLSALNWEECELGRQEMNRLRAPDVVVFENGQEAFYNAYGHLGWGDFMLALADETHRQQHRLTCYDAVLAKYYCQQADEHSPKPPLNSAARERLLQWFKAMPLAEIVNQLCTAGIPPLQVEWLEVTEPHRQGLEVLINALRQQHLHITHGLHVAVPVRFSETAPSRQYHTPWMEHLLMVFLQGDAKPLLLSLGCAPAKADSVESLMPLLPQFINHPCPHTLLEELLPLNQRSTEANSGVSALHHMVQWAEAQATQAFAYLRPQGIEIKARLQSKRLEDAIARAGTHGPRAYILLQGLVDKAKSLHHLLEAFQTVMASNKEPHPPSYPFLTTFITLGDGNVDEALLSMPFLALGEGHSPVMNHAYVVQNHASTSENRLYSRVKARNPNAQLVTGFPLLN